MNLEDNQQTCYCGHSRYDHIDWRLNNPEKRTNCRIIQCACESYSERFNLHQKEA